MQVDAGRIAAAQARDEADRVAKEIEQNAKAKATQELMAATAAQFKEHRRQQQGESVEYHVLRVGNPPGQGSPTDQEVREILKMDSWANGTVYGTLCYPFQSQTNGPSAGAFPGDRK